MSQQDTDHADIFLGEVNADKEALESIKEVNEILSSIYNSQTFSATSFGSSILDSSQEAPDAVPEGELDHFDSDDLYIPGDDSASEGAEGYHAVVRDDGFLEVEGPDMEIFEDHIS